MKAMPTSVKRIRPVRVKDLSPLVNISKIQKADPTKNAIPIIKLFLSMLN